MVFYGGIVAQRKRGFQSSFRRQPGRRRRKALLPGNGQRKGCGPSFGSLPGGMGGYVPVGDEGSDGPADLAPTLGVYCLRRSEERSDAPQAQPPPSKFHFEIWDAGYGDPYLTSFRKGRCLYWPADRHSRCSRRGRALPRPVWRCGYSDDRVGADLCVRPLPRRVQDSLVERNLSPAGAAGGSFTDASRPFRRVRCGHWPLREPFGGLRSLPRTQDGFAGLAVVEDSVLGVKRFVFRVAVHGEGDVIEHLPAIRGKAVAAAEGLLPHRL